MPDAYIYAGNWGHTHTITVTDEDGDIVDVSGATTKEIVFQRRGGSEITKEATFVTDGTDGQLRYTVESGEEETVDRVAGSWSRWAHVVFADGEYTSTPERYPVQAAGSPV